MKYFIDTYVLLNLKDYFGEGYDMQPLLWFFFLSVGVSIACFFLHVYKNALSLLAKQALRHKATSEEGAKTLTELGLRGRPIIRYLLRGEGHVYRVVSRLGAVTPTYEEYVAAQRQKGARKKRERLDLDTARFFIPEDRHAYAERLAEEGCATILRPIAAACAILLLYLLITLLAPSVLSLLVA